MAGSGQVCKFFLEGRCKFGAQCKFRHSSGGAGAGRGGGGWNNRRGGGGRHQGDPVDSGRRWDQRGGGNRFQLFSDSGSGGGGGGSGSYNSGSGWDDRGQSQWRGGGQSQWRGGGQSQWRGGGQSQWRGGGRGGTRGGGGGGRGGWGGGGGGGGTRQSSNYHNQRYQNDQYQNDRYSGDRYQQNWSTRGRGLFSDNQRSSNYQNSYQRIGRYGPASDSYDSHQHQAPETTQLSDPREIAAQIRLDMEEWNKSNMWPLSCYAYFKDTPCLPEFTDVSPEELRWEAYQAKTSGNSQQYLKTVGQLNDARLKVLHEFSNLTKDDVQDMLSGLRSNIGDANSSSQSLFAPSTTGTTVSSLFGHTTPTTSLFGSQKQSSSSLFQSSPPPTATTTGQQQAMWTTTGSLFGDKNSQEMLTKQVSTTVGLGQQQVSQAQTTQPSQSPQPRSATVIAADGKTNLTDKELEAFKANKFTLGQIPEHAPPEVLCN